MSINDIKPAMASNCSGCNSAAAAAKAINKYVKEHVDGAPDYVDADEMVRMARLMGKKA